MTADDFEEFDELSSQQLEVFKAQLLALKQTLKKDLSQPIEGSGVVELDQQAVGRLSRMDAMQNQQMALDTQRRYQAQLVEVEKALKRIENGSYGFCSQCDEVINPKRLAINPTSTECIHCAK